VTTESGHTTEDTVLQTQVIHHTMNEPTFVVEGPSGQVKGNGEPH
jgi:hypothetical protein